MSRIPVFTRTVLPDRSVGSAAISVARAPGDQKAEEFAQIGQAVKSVTDDVMQLKMREAQADNATAVNEASVDFKMKSADLLQQQRDARLGNPDNFHKDFDAEMEKLGQDYMKNAPSEAARVAIQNDIRRQRESAYTENLNWERTRKVEMFAGRVEKTTDDLGRLAYQRGASGQDASDLYRDADATTVAGSTFIAPEKIEKLNKNIRESITEGRIKGLASKDPTAAMKELEGMAKQHSKFDQSVSFTMNQEGGFVSNDAGKGPTNYGINQEANPDIDVRSLTPQRAQEIYKERYWNAIGADKMNPAFASIAFDGAVNQGVGWTKEAIAKANGDPQVLMQLREQRYRDIAAKNPDKAKFLNGWLDRLDKLKQHVASQEQFQPVQALPENTPGMIAAGTIDLLTRPVVNNPDGSISTVRSISINEDGQEVLIPTVTNDGRIMGNEEAIAEYRANGQHLGKFNSVEAANSYAQALHNQQADMYAPKGDGLSYDKIASLRTSIQTEIEKQIKLRNEDPISYMQGKGDLPIDTLSLGDPAFKSKVAQRENAARMNAANYGTPLNIFTKGEAQLYNKQFDTAPSSQKLAMLDTLRDAISSPRAYAAAIQQLRPDSPATAIAGMFLGVDGEAKVEGVGPRQVAQYIMEGEDLINTTKLDAKGNGKGSAFPMPPDGSDNTIGLRQTFSSEMGDAFAGRPEEQAQVYQAFKAYYAAAAAKAGDYSGTLNNDIAVQAARAVTGGTAEKNDRKFILPWGMDEDVFIDAAESRFTAMKSRFPQFFGGTEWGDVRLENTGEPGRYRMMVGMGYLHDGAGIPITLNMGR